jgi:hypothetical protein
MNHQNNYTQYGCIFFNHQPNRCPLPDYARMSETCKQYSVLDQTKNRDWLQNGPNDFARKQTISIPKRAIPCGLDVKALRP